MFCRFFLFKSNALEARGFSRENRLCFNRQGSPFDEDWPHCQSFDGCVTFDYWSCMAQIRQDPVLSRMPEWAFSEVSNWKDNQNRSYGIVVMAHVRDRENLFKALLGFARKNGLSIADPMFGLILVTPSDEAVRNKTWMRLRRIDVLDWILRTSKPRPNTCFSLCEHGAETFYSFLSGGWYGKPTSDAAIAFRDTLKEARFPDERLELFRGRVVIAGPNGAYRIHFNWEGCGKNAGCTADFTDPACPIVPLGRISIRLLRKRVVEFKTIPSGMFDPRVVERIPDPVDRYASLVLGNRKLTDRVPREIIAELKTQAGGN